MLQHIWELRDIVFDYYFFDENCSMRLLELLDVARPGHALAGMFPTRDPDRYRARRQGRGDGGRRRLPAGESHRVGYQAAGMDEVERRLALRLWRMRCDDDGVFALPPRAGAGR